MKRAFLISLLSALVGGAIVAGVIAAFGGLGKSHERTVTEIQSAPVASATSGPQQKATGLSYHEIYERTAPGVVFVTSTVVQQSQSPFPFGEPETQQGADTGSGIEIDSSGDILTNWHVVENAVKVTVGLDNSKTVEATVVGKDPSEDLAVLKIKPEGLTLHPLTLGDSSKVEVGEPVLAIGNPFDLERTLTTGVISALQRHLEAPNGFQINDVLQTDAAINPGNSGGPLLNAEGEVIGINSQIETGSSGSDGNIGIGFAVPINTAKKLIPQLEKGETVRGAYLGVSTLSIDGSLSALNLPVKSGALVQSVQKGSAAASAGIHGGSSLEATGGVALGGDIIVGVNGKQVNNSEDLARDIEEKQPGETVTIELWRAKGEGKYEKKTVKATLGKRPNNAPATGAQGSEEGGEGTPESLIP